MTESPSKDAAAETSEAQASSSAVANADPKVLMAQSWVQKLKRFNEGKQHKTAAENDREADVEFLKLLEEEK